MPHRRPSGLGLVQVEKSALSQTNKPPERGGGLICLRRMALNRSAIQEPANPVLMPPTPEMKNDPQEVVVISAENGGFEPPRAFTQRAFQARAIGH